MDNNKYYMKLIFWLIPLIAIILAVSVIFSGRTVFISPAFSGVILKDGHPMINVQVTRYTDYESSAVESVYTDSQGKFSFPALSKKSMSAFNPLSNHAAENIIYLNGKSDNKNVIYFATVDTLHPSVVLEHITASVSFDIDKPLIEYSFADKTFTLSARSDIAGYQNKYQ